MDYRRSERVANTLRLLLGVSIVSLFAVRFGFINAHLWVNVVSVGQRDVVAVCFPVGLALLLGHQAAGAFEGGC